MHRGSRHLAPALDRMAKALRVLALLALTAAIVVVGSCAMQVHHYNVALKQISVGDAEATVISRLGNPNFRELAGTPYLRYTGTACAPPCAVRLWWEWPLLPGIEAWSVELGKDNKVVKTYHWVST